MRIFGSIMSGTTIALEEITMTKTLEQRQYPNAGTLDGYRSKPSVVLRHRGRRATIGSTGNKQPVTVDIVLGVLQQRDSFGTRYAHPQLWNVMRSLLRRVSWQSRMRDTATRCSLPAPMPIPNEIAVTSSEPWS